MLPRGLEDQFALVIYGTQLARIKQRVSLVQSKADILRDFALFSLPTGGIGSWLSETTPDDVFVRLGNIDADPLRVGQLNQLLVLGSEAPVDEGFFKYYWLQAPSKHPYHVTTLPGFDEHWLTTSREGIISLGHLRWGLYRLYVDGLLFFGNVRTAFRTLRDMSFNDIESFFSRMRYDAEGLKRRGPYLPLKTIAKDNRYLISEMACKSYGDGLVVGDMREALVEAYKAYASAGNPSPTVRQLIENRLPSSLQPRQQEFIFSADELLDQTVVSEADLAEKYERIAEKFDDARKAALSNTHYYLSMLSDLDVYVATSMRSRQDFRNMADTCDRIFSDTRLTPMNLRYFDPTLSAAAGHEDKGLIECLMVKCAKVLIYCAGDKESYGKDAEAAMALSLGKPVIFYCDQEQRRRFYRDVHPLSRLINFETGVAVGAMVTDNLDDVPELLFRILENKMVYELEQSKPGFLRLKEKLTGSGVRLQTNDQLLAEAFWNHYHRDRSSKGVGVASA